MAKNTVKMNRAQLRVSKLNAQLRQARLELRNLRLSEVKSGLKHSDGFAQRLRNEVLTSTTPFTARQITEKIVGHPVGKDKLPNTRTILAEFLKSGVLIRTTQNTYDAKNTGRLVYMRVK